MSLSWLLLARNLVKAFLHPSTDLLLIKTNGGCVHTYIKQQLSPKLLQLRFGDGEGALEQREELLDTRIEGDFNQSIPTVLL